MPPKVMTRNDRGGGVLPVNAATRAALAKPAAARLKLEIRRLPPGLTLTELEEILGEEWRLGQGKVDWREYRQGKIKSPGKTPEQSRCYIHLKNEALVKDFEIKFLNVLFHDKAGTHRVPELRHLLPSLGFAPNQRTPLQAKPRADNRQGMIDQDAEFIAFLEAETMPIIKAVAVENVGAEKEKPEPVKSTPLIDDLRERKANKAKAAASKISIAKADKEKDKKVTAHGRNVSKEVPVEKDVKAQPSKVEQAAREAAKVLNKQAVGKQQKIVPAQAQVQQAETKSASPARQKKPAQKAPSSTPAQTTATGASGPALQRGPAQRQRGNNTEGIKKMLQKDLGIKPKATPTIPASKPSPQPAQPATAPTGKTYPAPSTPPASVPAARTASRQASTARSTTSSTSFPAHATKAYLKHANPSQGMTEVLIMKALGEYGEMNNVTIDPRKGTAIAVFKDNVGLKKAMDAKRVTVANGAVEVLEFKERQGAGAGGGGGGGGAAGGQQGIGRGGFRGTRGGGRPGRGGAATANPSGTTPATAPAPVSAAPATK